MAAPDLPLAQTAWRRRSSRLDPIVLVVGALTILALFFILLQVAVVVVGAFRTAMLHQPGVFTLANFASAAASPNFLDVARNTLVLGLGSMVVMLVWAVPFAWLYARTDLPGKNLFILLLTVKIAIPSFLIAMGYVFLANPSSGILNHLLKAWFGITQPVFNVYHMNWIIFLQGTALATPAFFMIVPAFQALDAALEEGAYASGVRQGRTFFGITLPLLAPAILAAGLYYMIVAMEIFDYAGMLGLPARIFVFSTWIYQLINPPDGLPQYNAAAAFGFMFIVLSTLLMLGYFWAIRRAERFAVVTGKRGQQKATKLGRRGVRLAWAAIILYSLLEFVIPVSMVVWASLLPYLQPPSMAALQSISLSGYRQALVELPKLLRTTLLVALAVPTISVAMAACLSWVVVRTKITGRRLIELIIISALGVPSIVGSLGFMYFGLSIYRILPLYSTVWIIVLAMATRYLTWGTRTINSSMYQIHKELEEACAISGVRPGRVFLSVVLPIVRPALVFSWFWIALLTLRELTIPLLLSRTNTQVLATAIWGFNAGGSFQLSAAMGVVLLLLVGTLVAIFGRLVAHRA